MQTLQPSRTNRPCGLIPLYRIPVRATSRPALPVRFPPSPSSSLEPPPRPPVSHTGRRFQLKRPPHQAHRPPRDAAGFAKRNRSDQGAREGASEAYDRTPQRAADEQRRRAERFIAAKRLVAFARGIHPVPSRTRQLSPSAPMVLRLRRGRVGRRQPLTPHSPPELPAPGGCSRFTGGEESRHSK